MTNTHKIYCEFKTEKRRNERWAAIDSAIGYWQVNPQSVNAKVLSRYYFLLQMTIAEQVSSVKNTVQTETASQKQA